MTVTLSATLIYNPEMLELDEPFINLDIKTTQIITELLKSLKHRKTIYITSHNLELVANIGDRYLILDKGVLIEDIQKSAYPDSGQLKKAIKILVFDREEATSLN